MQDVICYDLQKVAEIKLLIITILKKKNRSLVHTSWSSAVYNFVEPRKMFPNTCSY